MGYSTAWTFWNLKFANITCLATTGHLFFRDFCDASADTEYAETVQGLSSLSQTFSTLFTLNVILRIIFCITEKLYQYSLNLLKEEAEQTKKTTVFLLAVGGL